MVLPAAQGSAGTFLGNDGSGNLSWSVPSGSPTSFTLVNNQATPANVTGFTVNSASNKAWEASISIARRYTDAFVLDANFNAALGTGLNTPVGAYDVAVQSDGKVIAVGDFTKFNGTTVPWIVRINTDGSIDSAFNFNIGTGPDSTVSAVSIQSDGKIVIGGAFANVNGTSANGLARLNSDGTVDTAFCANSTALTSASGNRILIQADGKIVTNTAAAPKLIRLNTDGTEDTTFTSNLGTGFGSSPTVIKELSDNRLICGGAFTSFNGGTRNRVVMLNSDGTQDSTWYTTFTSGMNQIVSDIAVNPDDSMVFIGSFTSAGGSTRNYIVKVSGAGVDDSTFYSNIGTGGLNNAGYAISRLADGSLVIGGDFTSVGTTSINRVAALNSDGTENTFFTSAVGTGADASVSAFAVDASGNIYISGTFTTMNSIALNSFAKMAGLVELMSELTLRGVYRPSLSSWDVGGETGIGDVTGIDFSMTSAGQLQYTSTNIVGTQVESLMKFILEPM